MSEQPVTIRPAESSDVGAIGIVAEATKMFSAELVPSMIDGYLRSTRSDIWLVCTTGGQVRGFAFCEPERMTSGTWNLLAIAVLPDSQNSGFGSALVQHLESHLRFAGQRILLVETLGTPEFDHTRSFYKARGFAEEARIRDFYEDGGDKIIFWKRL